MSLRNKTAEKKDGRTFVSDKRDTSITCFVVIFTYINVFWSFKKKICLLRRVKFGEKFQTNLLSPLSHKPGLLSSFLFRPVA